MEIETKQINITTAYSEGIASVAQIKTIDIRNQIIELWDKQPIISQFPDFVTIIEPTQQVTIVIQGRIVTVSNQEVKKFETRDLENFLRLVLRTNEILQKPIAAFGYNYTFLIPVNAEDRPKIDSKIKKNINLTEMGVPEKDFITGGINLCYMKSSLRIQIITMPQFAEDLKNPIAFVVQCNVHFSQQKLPAFAELLGSFKDEHSYLEKEVEKILS
ncbi:MAG: hypothetical protein Q8N62_02985 [Candidatus Omnitrophota bacterium]|nr:hypothetical protein [Candidatus Omnitrophota bacterium]